MKAAIALGSNLGPSLEILAKALDCLAKTPGVDVVTWSSWYQTVPVGPPQPDYINGCAILEVELAAEELLQLLLQIEQDLGRVRQHRWGPRILDLDLLLYDQVILKLPQLEVPHPRLRERAFVLVPLAEIAPDWIEPVSRRAIAYLRDQVNCTGVSLISYEP